MNGWLIEDEDEPLEHEALDKEVDSDLESTVSSKPMMKKTTKADLDCTFQMALNLRSGPNNNNNNNENPDIATITAQQLQTLLPQIVTQVTNNVNNANGRNGGNGGNGRKNGNTYKGFMACNPKEYNGKGGQEIEEEGDGEEHVEDVTTGNAAQRDDSTGHGEVPTISQEPSIPSPTPPPQPPQDLPSTSQGRIIDEMDKDDVVALMDDKEEDKKGEKAKVDENDQVQGRQAESQAKI
nr:hypothetical protein [Tanacetum cinerariifolium]